MNGITGISFFFLLSVARSVLSECPKICTLEYAPVCASDGKTYSNKCFFEAAKCTSNSQLTIVYQGVCKDKREASIECLPRMKQGVCTREYRPVCGTDGKTYSNKCTFCYAQAQSEKNGETVEFDYTGKCTPKVECSEDDRSGVCTREYFPICGTDGKTYGNRCTFCYEKFQKNDNGEELEVSKVGECGVQKRSADDVVCEDRFRSGACTREYFPICGTDGKTYGNQCTFCFAKFRKNDNGEELEVSKIGQCNVVKRSADVFCEDRFRSGACTREYFPICGTDGKTYGNQCTYCFAKFQKNDNGEELEVSSIGECKVVKRSADVVCEDRFRSGACTREYFPICGTDGKTYGNKCTFCFAKFQKNDNLEVSNIGECKVVKRSVDDVVCEERFRSGACTREYFPICGTNGKTYGNQCTFCFAKFQKNDNGEELEVSNIGECKVKSADDFCEERFRSGICTKEYFPICGTDGKTYGNQCTFCFAKFQKNKNGDKLEVSKIGECKVVKRSADDVVCEDRFRSGACTREYFPICGTDGKTYGNRCTFCFAKFQKNDNLEVSNIGECKVVKRSVDDVVCEERFRSGACTREYSPICGTDGKTYGNRCTFCYAKFQKNDNGEELEVSKIGQCSVAKPEECPEMSKHGACSYIFAPVCANSGETYPNQCTMCADMYKRQKEGENVHLHVVHEGEC